mmetsp:Transcript_121884/g.316453  ORF Transcript_121884/g.316453 Transcript_121884/m.316453 type:complete len:244 (+) Transcript_121884:62-793(+)
MEVVAISAALVGVSTMVTGLQKVAPYLEEKRLPKFVAMRNDWDMIPVLVVHVSEVEMASSHQGARYVIHAKYGSQGHSLRCEAASFSPACSIRHKFSRLIHRRGAFAASADISSTCLFLQNEFIDPVIQLKVRKAGPWRHIVARGSIPLADVKAMGKVDLPLLGESAEKIGRVSIACEGLKMQRQDLVQLVACAGCSEQRDAYLISGFVAKVTGVVVCDDDTSSNTDAAIGVRSNFEGSVCWV